jgi:hypothetical protein
MPAPGGAPPPPSDYLAYLLRLWRDGPGTPWRASLETPGGGAPVRFGTVAALFAFLRDQLADPGAPPRRPGPAAPPRARAPTRRGAPRPPAAPEESARGPSPPAR